MVMLTKSTPGTFFAAEAARSVSASSRACGAPDVDVPAVTGPLASLSLEWVTTLVTLLVLYGARQALPPDQGID
jgi:hypothetical protein